MFAERIREKFLFWRSELIETLMQNQEQRNVDRICGRLTSCERQFARLLKSNQYIMSDRDYIDHNNRLIEISDEIHNLNHELRSCGILVTRIKYKD